MPTIGCKPQGDGSNQGWSLYVGTDFAYQAVSDSAGTTHDSDGSYFRLPRLAGAGGTVSFPFFRGWSGGVPTQIVVNVVAQRVAAAHPGIWIGFSRSGVFGFSGTLFTTTASWSLGQRTFITDPITGLAWDEDLLPMTEVCVQSESNIIGNNDVTLVSAIATYSEPHNHDPIMPTVESLTT